jgi:ribosome maturation protein SDO1
LRRQVAAYKNKVMNWRNRIETDIDEVLQIAQVFANVSKVRRGRDCGGCATRGESARSLALLSSRLVPQGVIAKGEDMKEAFGTEDHMKVALIILDKGELEVSGEPQVG